MLGFLHKTQTVANAIRGSTRDSDDKVRGRKRVEGCANRGNIGGAKEYAGT